jgi:hypothetical protein
MRIYYLEGGILGIPPHGDVYNHLRRYQRRYYSYHSEGYLQLSMECIRTLPMGRAASIVPFMEYRYSVVARRRVGTTGRRRSLGGYPDPEVPRSDPEVRPSDLVEEDINTPWCKIYSVATHPKDRAACIVPFM